MNPDDLAKINPETLHAYVRTSDLVSDMPSYNEQLLTTLFLGFKERKRENKLYTLEADTATALIKFYYAFGSPESFDHMKKAFVTKYCTNESKLEGVVDDGRHGTDEIRGMKEMYEYIHTKEIDSIMYTKNLGFGTRRCMVSDLNVQGRDTSMLRDAVFATTGTELALLELHSKLYSFSPNPDAAYFIRNSDSRIADTGQDICSWTEIGSQLKYLDFITQDLLLEAKAICESKNLDDLLAYLDKAVELKCKLIKIHPFTDGNGRTIRAFINKLLEDAGLPPIYIKPSEREIYDTAMNTANNEGDYRPIKSFYRYKIVDSIIELDINDRVNDLYEKELGVNNEEPKKRK